MVKSFTHRHITPIWLVSYGPIGIAGYSRPAPNYAGIIEDMLKNLACTDDKT